MVMALKKFALWGLGHQLGGLSPVGEGETQLRLPPSEGWGQSQNPSPVSPRAVWVPSAQPFLPHPGSKC